MRRPFLPRRVYIVSRAHFALVASLSPSFHLVADVVAVLRYARRHAHPAAHQTRVILKLFYLKFYNPYKSNVVGRLATPRDALAPTPVSTCIVAPWRRNSIEINQTHRQ